MPSSKPQYILDECVSIKLQIPQNPYFIESRDVLGKGASDDAIFEYAKKHKLMVVTRDYWFAEKILDEGYPVLVLLFRNRWGIVKPSKRVATLRKIMFDKYTSFIMEQNKIILP